MALIWLSDEDGMQYSVPVSLLEVWDDSEQWERDEILGLPQTPQLEDPAKRLEVIVALRAMGYSVEGGGPA